MKGLRRARAWLLSLAVLLAGCGTPSVSFPFEEVRFAVTGGVAGFDRALHIAPDGHYRVIDDGRTVRRGRLDRATLDGLKGLMKAVDWGGLRLEYADRRVADSLDMTLTLRTQFSVHVTMVGTGGDPPAAVAALVERLGELLRRTYRG